MNVTLRTLSGPPDSQAMCPECGELVDCYQLEYVHIGNSVHNTTLWHPRCDTRWKYDILRSETTILRTKG